MTQMTQGAIESPARSDAAIPEAERQLIAAVERHREALASMRELGRPESGQHVASRRSAVPCSLSSSRSGMRRKAVFPSSGSWS